MNKEDAGLEGFGPSTTGLKVRCATWLRHKPTQKMFNLYNLDFYKSTSFGRNF